MKDRIKSPAKAPKGNTPEDTEAVGPEMSGNHSDLRRRAEKVLRKEHGVADKIPSIDEHKSDHELRVHQVELEMQNDELRRVQQELEAAREKYFDLYDMAPAGYVSLSEKGI